MGQGAVESLLLNADANRKLILFVSGGASGGVTMNGKLLFIARFHKPVGAFIRVFVESFIC